MIAMAKTSKRSELVLQSSLQTFFFDHLNGVNQKSSHPLPKEMVYYSSIVMERFGESKNYFQQSAEGKLSEKILGEKFLKSTSLPKNRQINELKDIGDTSLFLCGYFSDSLNRKIVDTGYYRQIGSASYKKLNIFLPSLFELENFYESVAKLFDTLAAMMSIVAQSFLSKTDEEFALLVSNEFKIRAAA